MKTDALSSSKEMVALSSKKKNSWYLVPLVIAMSFTFGAIPIIYGFTHNSVSTQNSVIPGETTLWSTAID
ncbi:hypothetical protein [Crocosphaera sp. Alani8]|uniref:hypothetical protein n=1 Tax=Crocosphaera sp. Alani8 TaxID=3038952 RepID=UPI00313A8427